jgi:DNA-binding response OmpR family regulator
MTEPLEPVQGARRKDSGAHILVCEDDPEVATLIRLMLEQGGYQVDVAPDVARANRMIAQTSYDAVTMDFSLPGEDGLSFIRTLHRRDETCDLPIVVVSANAEQGRAQFAGAAVGVVDWLNKPIDRGRLLAAIKCATRRGAPKILCVEDDHDLALVIKSIIGGEGQVHHADSLRRAEEWLDGEQFDLIILDLALPDGPGLSLLPRINRTDDPPPVLVFSAHELSPELFREVSAALVKSQTDHVKLVETVSTLIDARRRARGY